MSKIFDIIATGYYISKNVYSEPQSPRRKVTKYELELYSTDEHISVINDVKYKQSTENILVAKPGDYRYTIGAFESYYVHFHCGNPEIMSALDTLPSIFSPSNIDKIKNTFKDIAIVSHKLTGINKTLFQQGVLAELISLLLTGNEKKYCGKYERYLPAVFSACQFIEKNYSQHIMLSHISASVNLSPNFFHTVFKSVKNMTPAQYLLNVRIIHAKEMLIKSNAPISEIALDCGFESQSYFNYVFKKYARLAPKEYRSKKQIII